MSITPFPSQGQYPWYAQLEQWGADTQAAAEANTIAADQVHADVNAAVTAATTASASAVAAAGLVGAPAGEAVDAAIKPSGAARATLMSAVEGSALDAASAQWGRAWAGTTQVLREWYRVNTGPRMPTDSSPVIVGEVIISNQAEADSLIGKTINGHIVIVSSNIELHDFTLKGDGAEHLIAYPAPIAGLHIHHIEVDGQDSSTTDRGLNGPSVTTTAGAGLRLEYCNFHNLNDGFMAAGGGIYRYNWVHSPFLWDTNSMGEYDAELHPHSDGIQMSSGSNTVIARNFIEMVGSNPNIISAIILNAASNPINNVAVSQNYLAGGGYTVHLLDDGFGFPTNVTIDRNKFGGGYNTGLFNYSTAALTFTENTWADTGDPIPTVTGATEKHAVQRVDDPMNIGYVTTHLGVASATVWGGANEARYLRALSPGVVGRIAIEVAVQSGNVSVGVYRATGDRFNRKPSALIASATVMCPPVGLSYIALDATVNVQAGDYLAMSCDNGVASFLGFTGSSSLLFGGQYFRSTDSFPLPATASVLAIGGYRMPVIAGVA